jgi:lipoprotein-anchoring transpeptidase ErfK/SrfK
MFKRNILPLFIIGFAIASIGLLLQLSPPPQRDDAQDPIIPLSLTGEYDTASTLGEFHTQKVASAELSDVAAPKVLGDTNATKRIEVDLSTQRLYAYEGDNKVYDFLISSGKWNKTPTGTFHIWGKFRFTKMSGGSKERHTYYYLPNVPYVMFFSNDEVAASQGFSLHGTYWHSNFGTPMSHGCINMKTEEAGLLYEWSLPSLGDKKSGRADDENPGTEVKIYGEAPKE